MFIFASSNILISYSSKLTDALNRYSNSVNREDLFGKTERRSSSLSFVDLAAAINSVKLAARGVRHRADAPGFATKA